MKKHIARVVVFLSCLLSTPTEAAGRCERALLVLGSYVPWVAPRILEYSVAIELVDRESENKVSLVQPILAPQGVPSNFSVPLIDSWFPGLVLPQNLFLKVAIRPGRAFLRTGSVEIALFKDHEQFAGGVELKNEQTMTFTTPALNYSIHARAAWVSRPAPPRAQ